jgi:hypothetical protein
MLLAWIGLTGIGLAWVGLARVRLSSVGRLPLTGTGPGRLPGAGVPDPLAVLLLGELPLAVLPRRVLARRVLALAGSPARARRRPRGLPRARFDSSAACQTPFLAFGPSGPWAAAQSGPGGPAACQDPVFRGSCPAPYALVLLYGPATNGVCRGPGLYGPSIGAAPCGPATGGWPKGT